MVKFLLWCILLALCWPLALLALVVYPFVWLGLPPFRGGWRIGSGVGSSNAAGEDVTGIVTTNYRVRSLYQFLINLHGDPCMASMRRHSQVKTPWRLFFFCNKRSFEFWCNRSSSVGRFSGRFASVNMRLFRTGPTSAASALAGDPQGGGSPLGGEPAASMRAKRSFLARSVPPGVGGTHPPRLALGGNGKGGQIPCCRRLFLSFRSSSVPGPSLQPVHPLVACRSTAATRLASIRTLK